DGQVTGAFPPASATPRSTRRSHGMHLASAVVFIAEAKPSGSVNRHGRGLIAAEFRRSEVARIGLFKKDDEKDAAKRPDFSNVRSGGSSTAPPGATPEGTAPATGARTYTVVAGDSLSKIAKHE